MDQESKSRVPWNWQSSLKEMCNEIDVDYDQFIAELAKQQSDEKIAQTFNTSLESIVYLRKHFNNYGIGSVFGQD